MCFQFSGEGNSAKIARAARLLAPDSPSDATTGPNFAFTI